MKTDFQRVLLRFRLRNPVDQDGAFPRTTAGAPSAWTTGQAVLALLSLGAPWSVVRPSVEWLLKTQGASGGWNFPGSNAGRERLIYTFYPTLVLVRCRRYLGTVAKQALSRVAAFVDSCEEHEVFWRPLREHIRRLATTSRKIACAFNYEGHTTEFNKLGRIPVLKAIANPVWARFALISSVASNTATLA